MVAREEGLASRVTIARLKQLRKFRAQNAIRILKEQRIWGRCHLKENVVSQNLSDRATCLVRPVILDRSATNRASEFRRGRSSRASGIECRVQRSLVRLVVHDERRIVRGVDSLEKIDETGEMALVLGANEHQTHVWQALTYMIRICWPVRNQRRIHHDALERREPNCRLVHELHVVRG